MYNDDQRAMFQAPSSCSPRIIFNTVGYMQLNIQIVAHCLVMDKLSKLYVLPFNSQLLNFLKYKKYLNIIQNVC